MRCVSDLEKLRIAILLRSHRLDNVWRAAVTKSGHDKYALISYLTLELDNLLVLGMRQFTKSSLLRCRTVSGVRVHSESGANSPERAAALVLEELNRKRFEELNEPVEIVDRFEQTFREPRDTLRVLRKFRASNDVSVLAGMAYNGKVFSEIGTARNFFAHRCAGTYERMTKFGERVGFGARTAPEAIVSGRRRGRPASMFEEWNIDVRTFFDAALR